MVPSIGATYRLNNINNFKDFLEKIKIIEIYDEEVEYLYNSSLFSTTLDSINLEKAIASELFNKSNYLINSTSSLTVVFNKLLPKSSENSISIKLPEPSDFEELNKLMSTIQKAISQVIVNDTIKGSTKINNWEYGSFWIELILDSQAAVTLIASIAWSAAVISKKINENKILEQTVRAMKLKGDSLDDILEKQKLMTVLLIENEAKAIHNKNFKADDYDKLERLKSSIKTFSTLIQNGAEVHSSLIAPEKIQNLFPNFKEIDLISSNNPTIENKSSDNN